MNISAITISLELILVGQDLPPIKFADRNVIGLTDYHWKKHCRGLFQLPITTQIRNSPGTGLDQQYLELGMADATPDDVMQSVCDSELPDAGEVCGGVLIWMMFRYLQY